MDDPKQLTTYKRTDGELVGDDWGWVTELDFFDDNDEPVELVEEVWVRQSTRTFWQMPGQLYSCGFCDNDADKWWRSPGGVWWQVCADHPTGITAKVSK